MYIMCFLVSQGYCVKNFQVVDQVSLVCLGMEWQVDVLDGYEQCGDDDVDQYVGQYGESEVGVLGVLLDGEWCCGLDQDDVEIGGGNRY